MPPDVSPRESEPGVSDPHLVDSRSISPSLPNHHTEATHLLFGHRISKKRAVAFAHLGCFLNQIVVATYAVWSQWTLMYLPAEFLLFSRLVAAAVQIWSVSLFCDAPSAAMSAKPFSEVWTGPLEIIKVYVLGALVFVLNVYMYLRGIR